MAFRFLSTPVEGWIAWSFYYSCPVPALPKVAALAEVAPEVPLALPGQQALDLQEVQAAEVVLAEQGGMAWEMLQEVATQQRPERTRQEPLRRLEIAQARRLQEAPVVAKGAAAVQTHQVKLVATSLLKKRISKCRRS